MRRQKRLSLFFISLLISVLFATPARLHPHVFAEARLDVALNPDGTVKNLRHLWRFDDVFSSTILLEFDANSDLQLDTSELDTVAGVVKESIAEYDFFQSVTANGKPVPMAPPETLIADFQDNQFIILFESAPAKPLRLAGKLAIGVSDPTFYTAIEFLEDTHMKVEGESDGCSSAVIRPDPDEAIAQNQQTLTEEFFNDPTGNDISKLFATRLELTCPASG